MKRAELLEQVEGFPELDFHRPLAFPGRVVSDELPDPGTKVFVPLEEPIRGRGVPDADRAVGARRGQPPPVWAPVQIVDDACACPRSAQSSWPVDVSQMRIIPVSACRGDPWHPGVPLNGLDVAVRLKDVERSAGCRVVGW